MQNFLAKAVAVAMLVGGFSLTGDLGWIAEKGQRIVGAADVPAGFDNTVALEPQVQPAPVTPSPAAAPTDANAAPVAQTQPVHEHAMSPAPLGGPEPAGAAFKPPVSGLQEISWASLGTGSRVIVWFAGPPFRCIVLDFVAPSSGEALLYEVATVDADGKPLATAGPPRRVVVGRDQWGRPHGAGFMRGGSIHIAQTGVAAHAAGQWLGPIASLSRGD
jgi:hypothetical protein